MTQATTTAARDLTPSEAYAIASQWGSYIRNGDPGACFYCFHPDDGRPIDDGHRADVLAQIDVRLARPRLSAGDRRDLKRLAGYIRTAPLYSRRAA
jgi:hypothetical protein